MIVALEGIFFFSLATFCAAITGNIIALPAIYGLFNVIFIVFEYLIKVVVAQVSFGASQYMYTMKTEILTPIYWLSDAQIKLIDSSGNIAQKYTDIAGMRYNCMGYLICCAVVGLILAAISIAIIRYRHMETATDVISVKCLLPVFRYGAAFGSSLALGEAVYMIFFQGETNFEAAKLAVFLVLFCIVGYFAAEMLVQKSFRVFSKWKGALAAALVVILFMAGLSFDVFGIEKKVPAEDKVAYAVVSVYDETAQLSTAEGIKGVTELHKKMIDNKEFIKNYDQQYNCCYLNIMYFDEDGGIILRRQYCVPVIGTGREDELRRDIESLLNSDEAVESRLHTDILDDPRMIDFMSVNWRYEEDYQDISLDREQIEHIVSECMIPDIKDGNLGKIDLRDHFRDDLPRTELNYSFKNDVAYYSYSNITVPAEATRTTEYINELANQVESGI